MPAAWQSQLRGILGVGCSHRVAFRCPCGLHHPNEVNSATLPPAAVVLMLTVCSEQKRGR
jgi:hypothetical protein